jgi:cobalt-precorrin-5B (C1)-methyltransferase
MITEAVKEVLPQGVGVEVTISAPQGVLVAKKTMNAKLGVEGGVSILGTTGVVKPLSSDACRRSLVPQIDVALARVPADFCCSRQHWGANCKRTIGAPEMRLFKRVISWVHALEAVEKVCKNHSAGHSGKLVK